MAEMREKVEKWRKQAEMAETSGIVEMIGTTLQQT